MKANPVLDSLLGDLAALEWKDPPEQQGQFEKATDLMKRIAPVADERANRPLVRIMGHFYNCGLTTELRKQILGILKATNEPGAGLLVFQVLESDDLTAEAATKSLAAHRGSGAEEALAAAMQLCDPEGKAPKRAMAALSAMGYQAEAQRIKSWLPHFPHNVPLTKVRSIKVLN